MPSGQYAFILGSWKHDGLSWGRTAAAGRRVGGDHPQGGGVGKSIRTASTGKKCCPHRTHWIKTPPTAHSGSVSHEEVRARGGLMGSLPVSATGNWTWGRCGAAGRFSWGFLLGTARSSLSLCRRIFDRSTKHDLYMQYSNVDPPGELEGPITHYSQGRNHRGLLPLCGFFRY